MVPPTKTDALSAMALWMAAAPDKSRSDEDSIASTPAVAAEKVSCQPMTRVASFAGEALMDADWSVAGLDGARAGPGFPCARIFWRCGAATDPRITPAFLL